jgi:cell division protein FtsI/penicillin-binding protein 2
MIRAVATIANGGRLITPYIVAEIHADNGTIYHEQQPDFYPIRPETAQQVTTMAIAAVAREVSNAQVAGYTIAGKTGTAQISENGVYLDNEVIGSFVGWLPAEQPEIIIYIKLDRPRSAPWGSETAAPVFAELTEELVVLLDIPPDNIRNVLTANGGGQ